MSRSAVLRLAAVAIAVAGLVDPAIRTTQPGRPDIAVIHAGAPALADAAANALADEFNVVRGAYSAAAATVLVGRTMTPDATTFRGPAFVVLPDDLPAIEIVAVHAASRASTADRVPVSVSVRSRSGGTADVALEQAGVVTDRTTIDFEPADGRKTVTMWFVPMSTGPSALHITAAQGDALAAADIAIDVRPATWRVLFFDKRPSWMSTFLRRSLQSDPRFAVVTRVVTSRDISVDVGGAPSGLGRLADLSSFDAIVVGAPEALTSTEVGGLEAFARRRGGTIVLPMDQRVDGVYERLLGVAAWREYAAPGAVPVRPLSPSSEPLMASELAWPAELPDVAEPLALYADGSAETDVPVIWRTALGAGEVIVSGALDGWRYRSANGSGFDEFWRQVFASAAARAMDAVAVTPRSILLRPGEALPVFAVLRDIALAADAGADNATATVSAAIEGTPSGSPYQAPVRLWPQGAAGQLSGVIDAPDTPGTYRLVVRSGDHEGDASILVEDSISAPTADQRALLSAWAHSRGGAVITARDLATLGGAIRHAVDVPAREADWHPMRSAWWMVPFALALTTEWWWRRRRGQL